ncbi:hypothetical protein MRX96_033586 [Rhipicephalus microplus]
MKRQPATTTARKRIRGQLYEISISGDRCTCSPLVDEPPLRTPRTRLRILRRQRSPRKERPLHTARRVQHGGPTKPFQVRGSSVARLSLIS